MCCGHIFPALVTQIETIFKTSENLRLQENEKKGVIFVQRRSGAGVGANPKIVEVVEAVDHNRTLAPH